VSIKYMELVFQCPALDPREKMVMLVLADRADTETGFCWPGVKSIAERSGCDRTTVFRVLRRLEKKGMLERSRRFKKDGSMDSNGYFLNEGGLTVPLPLSHSGTTPVAPGHDPSGTTPHKPPVEPSGETSMTLGGKKQPQKKVKTVDELIAYLENLKNPTLEDLWLQTSGFHVRQKTVVWLWRRLYKTLYAKDKPVVGLTEKQALVLRAACVKLEKEGDWSALLIGIVMKWPAFVNICTEKYGAYNPPARPCIYFLSKYLQAAVDYAKPLKIKGDKVQSLAHPKLMYHNKIVKPSELKNHGVS